MTDSPSPSLVKNTLELTGHIHGFAIRFDGAEIDVFPDFQGASEGFKAAKAALSMLEACLNQERAQ